MATTCADPAVLAGLFLAAYSGNLADVKSALKNNALSADVADPDKVRGCVNVCLFLSLRSGGQGVGGTGSRQIMDRSAEPTPSASFLCPACSPPGPLILPCASAETARPEVAELV